MVWVSTLVACPFVLLNELECVSGNLDFFTLCFLEVFYAAECPICKSFSEVSWCTRYICRSGFELASHFFQVICCGSCWKAGELKFISASLSVGFHFISHWQNPERFLGKCYCPSVAQLCGLLFFLVCYCGCLPPLYCFELQIFNVTEFS